MPNSTANVIPTFFRGAPGTTQGAIRPIRMGFRPYAQSTRGKRQVMLDYDRMSTSATPAYATVGLFGIELPYETADFGTAANGQKLPGFQPNTGGPGQPVQSGTYVERVRLTGGAGTSLGLCTVLDGGQDVTAAPTVVFTPATGGPAATAVIRDRRVVGVVVTGVGGPFTTPPVVSFTGGGSMTVAPTATVTVGQQTTINTHIPFAAHSPLAAGGAYWMCVYQDRIIACNQNALFVNVDDGAVDPDQHIMGNNANQGFTVSSGTHPDGTANVGIITLILGLPNNVVVTVYRGTVRELSAIANHLNDQTQIRTLDLVYAVVGGAGDNSTTSIVARPANFGIG